MCAQFKANSGCSPNVSDHVFTHSLCVCICVFLVICHPRPFSSEVVYYYYYYYCCCCCCCWYYNNNNNNNNNNNGKDHPSTHCLFLFSIHHLLSVYWTLPPSIHLFLFLCSSVTHHTFVSLPSKLLPYCIPSIYPPSPISFPSTTPSLFISTFLSLPSLFQSQLCWRALWCDTVVLTLLLCSPSGQQYHTTAAETEARQAMGLEGMWPQVCQLKTSGKIFSCFLTATVR